MDYVIIFAAGYASVFLLGFQSRLVNYGNYAWAAGCSFSIALAQGLLWSKIMDGTPTVPELMAYGLSGACAITSAMFVHARFFVRRP